MQGGAGGLSSPSSWTDVIKENGSIPASLDKFCTLCAVRSVTRLTFTRSGNPHFLCSWGLLPPLPASVSRAVPWPRRPQLVAVRLRSRPHASRNGVPRRGSSQIAPCRAACRAACYAACCPFPAAAAQAAVLQAEAPVCSCWGACWELGVSWMSCVTLRTSVPRRSSGLLISTKSQLSATLTFSVVFLLVH